MAVVGYLTTDDGVRLFFRKAGTGPQVVLIPNGLYLFDDFQHLSDSRTLIFYDVRNRGRSDSVTDPGKLARGLHHDVDDMDAVRRHFNIDRVAVMGHSYFGLVVALYAIQYGAHVDRVVQIGPAPPSAGKQYPRHLTCADETLAAVMSRLAQLQRERLSGDPQENCRRFWKALREIYVVNPADAERLHWIRCDLPNELNFMKYWSEVIAPSIQNLRFPAEELALVQAPFLIVHGAKDRSSPYGGGRDWALALPHARLVTVPNAAHAPWIEDPETVFGTIRTFLDGDWPAASQRVHSLEPGDDRRPSPLVS